MEIQEEQIQRLVKEEINKTREKTNWKRYKELCYKYFPIVIILNIILTAIVIDLITAIFIPFGLVFWFIVIYCIIWFFKLRDSSGKLNTTRATSEFISVAYVTLLVLGFIIGFIEGIMGV